MTKYWMTWLKQKKSGHFFFIKIVTEVVVMRMDFCKSSTFKVSTHFHKFHSAKASNAKGSNNLGNDFAETKSFIHDIDDEKWRRCWPPSHQAQCQHSPSLAGQGTLSDPWMKKVIFVIFLLRMMEDRPAAAWRMLEVGVIFLSQLT